MSYGAHAPRILALDDYFLMEVEKTEKDPDTGKKIKKKVRALTLEALRVISIKFLLVISMLCKTQ